MTTKVNQRQIYLKSTKEWVFVSEDFHKQYFRDVDTYRRNEQRHGRCSCPRNKWWLCDMDCLNCEFYCGSGQLSLDAEMATKNGDHVTLADTAVVDTATPESIIADQVLLDALWQELDALDPEGRHICELLSHLSEREAAKTMGLKRSTFKRHWAKVKALLAKKLSDFR